MKLTAERQSLRKANLPPAIIFPDNRVAFEYGGQTGLSVTGPVSGKRYRFDYPGAVVEVDPRDRILLGSLRQLRQVRT